MADPQPERVLVYDGDCAFCSSTARLLQRWVPADAGIVAWQRLDLAALGLTEVECDASVQWVDRRPGQDRRSSGALAFADLLRSARGPWRHLGALLALPPVQLLARPTYRWISRNRHRMPGGTPTCRLNGG